MPESLEVTRQQGIGAAAVVVAAAVVGGVLWFTLKDKDDEPTNGDGFGPLATRNEAFTFFGPNPLCETQEGFYDGEIIGDIRGTGWFVARFWFLGPGEPLVISSDVTPLDTDWVPFIATLGTFRVPPFTFPPGTNLEWQLEMIETDSAGTPLATLRTGQTTSSIAAC